MAPLHWQHSKTAWLAALALVASAVPCWAQRSSRGNEPRASESRPRQERSDADSALERWRRKSPREREVLRGRFDEWKRMDEGERRELVDRARRMRAVEERMLERLSEAERGEFERMEPDARREALRERFRRELVERGGELRAKLPPDLRERLEQATPAQRARLLREFKLQHRRIQGERALESLGRELELSDEERARLRALPQQEQWREVLKLRRREIQRHTERDGLPQWIDGREWSRWRELSDEEFIDRWHARTRARSGAGRGTHSRSHGGPPDGARDDSRGELR